MRPSKKARVDREHLQLQAVRLAMMRWGRQRDLHALLQLNRSWHGSLTSEPEWWSRIHWNCTDSLQSFLWSAGPRLVPHLTLHLQALSRLCTLNKWRTLCSSMGQLQELTLTSSRSTLGAHLQALVPALDSLQLVRYSGPLATCPVGPRLRYIHLDTCIHSPGRYTLEEVMTRCPRLTALLNLWLHPAQKCTLFHPHLQVLEACANPSTTAGLLELRGLPSVQSLKVEGNIRVLHLPRTLVHLHLTKLPPLDSLPRDLQVLDVRQHAEDLMLGDLPQLRRLRLRWAYARSVCLHNLPRLAVLECLAPCIRLESTSTLRRLQLPYANKVKVTGSLAGVRVLNCAVKLDCPAARTVTTYSLKVAQQFTELQHLSLHHGTVDSWLPLRTKSVHLDGSRCSLGALVLQASQVQELQLSNYSRLQYVLMEPGTLACLRRLVLQECSRLSVADVLKTCGQCCPQLRELRLAGAMTVVEQHVVLQSQSLHSLELDWADSCIHLGRVRLHCPQLRQLCIRAMRGYTYVAGDWLLPSSLQHLVLDYEMPFNELQTVTRQLANLVHLEWSCYKANVVKLHLPCLQTLQYRVSAPNMSLDVRQCPVLREVQLTAEPRSRLEQLQLPPDVPLVYLSRACHVDKGVPAHAQSCD